MIGDLFDLSLKNFITPRLTKLFYGLTLIPGAIGTALFMVFMWSYGTSGAGGGQAILLALVAPPVFVLWLLFTRLLVEIFLVVFRAVEHLQRIEKLLAVDAAERDPAPGSKERATFG